MILKSWKVIHDQQKFPRNILSNLTGGFLTLEAQKTWLMTKCQTVEKKLQKNAKIREVKLYSDLFANPRGGSLALEAEKNLKQQKFSKT